MPPLFYLSCAWLLGIYFGAKSAFPVAVLLSGLLPLCLLPFFPQYRKALLIASFCLFTFFGATFRFKASLPVVNEHSLQFYNDRGVVGIAGMVSSDPETKDIAQLIRLSASEIEVDNKRKGVSGTALIRTARYPEYCYGDVLKLTGKLETPQTLDNFDYKGYLERQGIYSVVNYPKIEVLAKNQGCPFLEKVYSLRNGLSQVITKTLPEPQGALAQGITLGIRGNIPLSLNQAFSRTGTAHLLAISGLHLSILIGMILSFGLGVFGKRYYLYIWLALLVIWFYALFTGMRPPIVRGAIMGSLFLLAEYLGRQRSAITALTLAAAVMVGIDPKVLWDAAFQLSFLAMAGLVFLAPPLQAWGRRNVSAIWGDKSIVAPATNMATDSFAVTLSAIIATAPAIAYYFGITSLVGLPATFLSLLALPGIIVTTIFIGLLGLVFLTLAQVLAWVDWLFLSYLIGVVQAFDALPLASFEINIHLWQAWLYYAIVMAIIWIGTSKRHFAELLSQTFSWLQQSGRNATEVISKLPKKWVVLSLLIITILVWSAVLTMPDKRLHVSFLDVGQGDAILIKTPNRQNILIDGGPSPQAISLGLSQKLPFWDRTIDLMILTQPQADHVTGLVEVLHRYKVKQVLEPGIAYSSPIYQEWLKLVREKKNKHGLAQAGQSVDLGKGIRIEILNPPSPFLKGTTDDIDNNGMVLRLSWNKVSFLLTADIEAEAEFGLIARRANLKSTVLKVAHHGSRSSTSAEFLALVDPQLAVISVGKDNKFGHPHSQVMERLKTKLSEDKIFLTSKQGTIEFITDGERLWLKTEKGK